MINRTLGLWHTIVIGAAGLLVFLGGWELLVRLGVIDPYFLPAPSQVIARMISMASGPDPVLWHDIRVSATRVMTGFILSTLVGVPVGLVMGMSSLVRAALNPIRVPRPQHKLPPHVLWFQKPLTSKPTVCPLRRPRSHLARS